VETVFVTVEEVQKVISVPIPRKNLVRNTGGGIMHNRARIDVGLTHLDVSQAFSKH
jgi:hypothetical protein